MRDNYAEISIPNSMIAVTEAGSILPQNIRAGVNYYGVTGTLVEGKPFASGTYSSAPAWNSLTITGLSFTPHLIIIRSNNTNAKQYVYLDYPLMGLNGYGIGGYSTYSLLSGTTWTIAAGSFSVSFGTNQQINSIYYWEAYGA
ncbi:hypothetical protein D3C73_992710 [compost metagenome]